MQKSGNTPLVADAERGEALVIINGEPRLIRFNNRFLKTLTDQKGGAGPGDILERLTTSTAESLGAAIDMAVLGIQLSTPGLTPDEALTILDEQNRADQETLYAVALQSVMKSPILAALNRGQAA